MANPSPTTQTIEHRHGVVNGLAWLTSLIVCSPMLIRSRIETRKAWRQCGMSIEEGHRVNRAMKTIRKIFGHDYGMQLIDEAKIICVEYGLGGTRFNAMIERASRLAQSPFNHDFKTIIMRLRIQAAIDRSDIDARKVQPLPGDAGPCPDAEDRPAIVHVGQDDGGIGFVGGPLDGFGPIAWTFHGAHVTIPLKLHPMAGYLVCGKSQAQLIVTYRLRKSKGIAEHVRSRQIKTQTEKTLN